MGLTPVAKGGLAAIVTSLEMTSRPVPRPMPASPFRLIRWKTPEISKYRALFQRVGAPWLWYSRLAITDAQLSAIIHDPHVEIFAAVDAAGIEVGMLELDFRQPHSCKLSYFALIPELTGKGHGRWLMAHALAMGWRKGIERLWVHTCTLDHPSALNFYLRSGFRAFQREIEIFSDPRVSGLLPREAAPHVPLLDAES